MNKTKRDDIVTSSVALFIEKGYLNTKIIDIAMKAGIGKGTVYEYFASKEDILLEVLSKVVVRDFQQISKKVEKETGCRNQLKAYLSGLMNLMGKYGSNMPDLTQQLLNPVNNVSVEILKILHDIIVAQYKMVLSILSAGAKAGEICDINLPMAAAAVIGGMNNYITIKAGRCSPSGANVIFVPIDSSSWNEEDFIDLLMSGLEPPK